MPNYLLMRFCKNTTPFLDLYQYISHNILVLLVKYTSIFTNQVLMRVVKVTEVCLKTYGCRQQPCLWYYKGIGKGRFIGFIKKLNIAKNSLICSLTICYKRINFQHQAKVYFTTLKYQGNALLNRILLQQYLLQRLNLVHVQKMECLKTILDNLRYNSKQRWAILFHF